MSTATSTAEHLRELLVVVERSADEGISLLSHEYSYLNFGSFVVECAVGHRQARLSWVRSSPSSTELFPTRTRLGHGRTMPT